MWEKVDENTRKKIVKKLETNYKKKINFIKTFLSIPFLMALIVCIIGIFSDELELSDGMPGIIVILIILIILNILPLKIKFPFDTNNIYISKSIKVDKVHLHHRNNTPISVIECGGYSARSKSSKLKEGDYCQFIHCGDYKLNVPFEIDCRYAIDSNYISYIYN